MSNINYTKANYTVAIEVTKSPNAVFNHIINDVSKFWPEEFEGESSKLNDEFVFRSGETHYSKNKVVEFMQDKKVVWLVTESIRKTDNFDWTGTKMIFELNPKDGHTHLQFTYDGVVLENEKNRLIEICDFVVKEELLNLIESFNATIEVAKSPQEVFKILTADVSKWWGGKDLSGRSTKLNDEFVIRHPGAHYSKQKLIEVIPDKKIVWLVIEGELDWLKKDKQEWTNTKMIFELTSNDDKTKINFAHYGLVPGKECYEKCERGWNTVIKDYLFNYITYGKIAEQLYR